jgi:hypothetical protein
MSENINNFTYWYFDRHEQEKAHASSENEELRRRMKQLETECEEMSENRLHLVGTHFD